MTQVSNNVAALIHAIGAFVISYVVGMILGPVIGFAGFIISGAIIVIIATLISAIVLKKFFSYSDSSEVVKMATIIVALISVVTSLRGFSVMPVSIIISIVLQTVIFYVVSKMKV